MIRILRHISVHLWMSTLFAIPVSFFVLSFLTRLFPGINPVFVCLPIVIGMGAVAGVLMDAVARKKVVQLIKEGQAWERSGIIEKAKKKYIRALRIYDTFLLWPFSARKTALKISSAIAGFELNNHSNLQNFKMGTTVYLKMNPRDTDLAFLWLSQIRRSSIVSSLEQEVLSVLARVHMKQPRLSVLIVDIFLGLRRSDLLAKKMYQQVLKDPAVAGRYADRIEELGATSPVSVSQQVSYEAPSTASHSESEIPLKNKIGIQTHLLQVLAKMSSLSQNLWSMFRQLGLAAWQVCCWSYSAVLSAIQKLIAWFKKNKQLRRHFKMGIMATVCAGFLFFMISTLTHTFKTRTIKEDKKNIQQAAIPKPFTIQVAAYLKQSHAQRYVDTLKKKKIDATVKEVTGGGKTWFVIRVSKFSDKKSAADYGNHLKQQHIIEDFFVNNR